jgi:uncharacterized protein (DUF934 family)
MPLLKPDGFVADDWILVGMDDPLPARGDVAVPWGRIARDWETLVKHDGRLGVVFPNSEKTAALGLYLPRLALIVLNFPIFNDGRSFSIARQLRLAGYAGEIRATGHLIPDLLQFMLQVGFDAFDVSERFSLDLWLKSMKRMSLTYQHGLEDRNPTFGAAAVWKARQQPSTISQDQKDAG